jgi:hypothetical protein
MGPPTIALAPCPPFLLEDAAGQCLVIGRILGHRWLCPPAKPGYPECVAMIVQIGDHLSKQFDLSG